MVSAQSAIYIILGIIICFMGYSLFRSILPLWGFILGGWLTFMVLPSILGADLSSQLAFQLGGVLIGGLIGAAIAGPLYFLIIFLSGAVLGMLLGTVLGAIVDIGGVLSFQHILQLTQMSFPPFPQTSTQWLLMIIGAVIFGGLAINFQKFMICASSAFLGSAGVVSGFGGSIAGFTGSDASQGAITLMIWLGLGIIGMFVQFRIMGDN